MTSGSTQRMYTIESIGVDEGELVPGKRGGATMTAMSNGNVYLIGGANREGECLGDVHCFDMNTRKWTLITPMTDVTLPPRSGHSATAVNDEEIYVFGGMNPMECVIYEDIVVFNIKTKSWRKPLIEGWMPTARNAHAAIQLATTQEPDEYRLLIAGGSSPEEGAFDDVYILHIPQHEIEAPVRWERCECTQEGEAAPEARELHIATFLSSNTICFSGGRNRDGNVCTDMMLLEVETWKWTIIPICEWNRCSHVAGMIDGALLSYGGWDGGSIRNDAWVYNDEEESWLPVVWTEKSQKPIARFGHCSCVVILPTQKKGLLVFGGMNAEEDLNDLVLIMDEIIE